jgi:hypothetical protein
LIYLLFFKRKGYSKITNHKIQKSNKSQSPKFKIPNMI